MGLVKAQMSFYHDSVGARAHNEVFEVQNEQVCAELEQLGYVQKASAEEVQAHEQQKQLQQQMGQKQALTNEAIATAQHAQNVEANAHTQNVAQLRQQARQQAEQLSEITTEDLKNYLHVYHAEDDAMISAILIAAKSFVKNYTGLSSDNLDISEDLSMAVFILGSELYDNRVFTVDKATVNPVIQTILDMHSVNLL